MSNAFLESITARRSIYSLGSELPCSEYEVISLITQAVKLSPSAFNSQSSRVVILFDEQHHQLWEIVKQELKKIVPPDAFFTTENKISSFAAGAGTVLFFEDDRVIDDLQKQYALYADNFPVWSEHSTGIAQFSVWSALAQVKIGASLQHYNPLIDEAVHQQWHLPAHWRLRAQMPFGSILQPPGEKSYMADEERFRIFK
ncbi:MULTISPECIES: nitroreductase family protein [Yersiniaceae]|uniref:Nitroreductase n=2 Tax=Yersiniaceae TaxID=1903411 RepID=A0A2N5EQW1_9GAMM|nr:MULTISPECIES: nitroreductase family protein [Yersiniaceae]MBS0970981.1 nitroreductase family protein [Nissabacter archeti]PLR29919.1 nitroreductase [Chimaeribacter arupi]PLR52107.1 nitroreductase [Chimaeribacter arupi]